LAQERLKNPTKATEFYQQLLHEYPYSQWSYIAKKHLEELSR